MRSCSHPPHRPRAVDANSAARRWPIRSAIPRGEPAGRHSPVRPQPRRHPHRLYRHQARRARPFIHTSASAQFGALRHCPLSRTWAAANSTTTRPRACVSLLSATPLGVPITRLSAPRSRRAAATGSTQGPCCDRNVVHPRDWPAPCATPITRSLSIRTAAAVADGRPTDAVGTPTNFTCCPSGGAWYMLSGTTRNNAIPPELCQRWTQGIEHRNPEPRAGVPGP